jgi:hypothetical protein
MRKALKDYTDEQALDRKALELLATSQSLAEAYQRARKELECPPKTPPVTNS